MEMTIKQEGTKTLVSLNGRIDTTNADKFQQDISQLMQDNITDVEIDCTNMEYTSSQGLRIFLMLQKHMMSHNGNLVLCNIKPQVKEVFDITGFSNIIKIK